MAYFASADAGAQSIEESAISLYDVKTAVCGCVSNNLSTTISLAAYVILMEAFKYLK